MNLGIIHENLGALRLPQSITPRRCNWWNESSLSNSCPLCTAILRSLHLAINQPADALVHSAKSLETSKVTGDRRSMAIALENLALAHLQLSEFSQCRKLIKEAYRISRDIGDKEREFSLDLVEAEPALAGKATRKTHAKLMQAKGSLEHNGFESERPRLLRLIASSHVKLQEKDLALAAANEAILEARRQENRTEQNRVQGIIEILKK